MKRSLSVYLSLILAAFFITSCEKLDLDPGSTFNESLIIGKWQNGTVYERYNTDSTGTTWDTGDDVSESEAQEFTWSIDGNKLEQIHTIENGGVVPKTYTLTTLSDTSLVYRDDFGATQTFIKN